MPKENKLKSSNRGNPYNQTIIDKNGRLKLQPLIFDMNREREIQRKIDELMLLATLEWYVLLIHIVVSSRLT